MAYSKYGLSFKNFTDSYGEWEANGGVEQANKAIDFKNLQNNSFNVRGLPGGTFGQSVIDQNAKLDYAKQLISMGVPQERVMAMLTGGAR